MEKLNIKERIELVKAMEFIARQINDEEIFECWLENGVADGEIPYGETFFKVTDLEELDYYITNENFSDLMETFIYVMSLAKKSGGLYCNGVVSNFHIKE